MDEPLYSLFTYFCKVINFFNNSKTKFYETTNDSFDYVNAINMVLRFVIWKEKR